MTDISFDIAAFSKSFLNMFYDHNSQGLTGYDTMWPPQALWNIGGGSVGGRKSYGNYYYLYRTYLAFNTTTLLTLPNAAEMHLRILNNSGIPMCSLTGLRFYYFPWGPAPLPEWPPFGDKWGPLTVPATDAILGAFDIGITNLIFPITDLSGIVLSDITYMVLASADESIVPINTPMHDLDVYAEFSIASNSNADPCLVIL
jgi:hypothetical protein